MSPLQQRAGIRGLPLEDLDKYSDGFWKRKRNVVVDELELCQVADTGTGRAVGASCDDEDNAVTHSGLGREAEFVAPTLKVETAPWAAWDVSSRLVSAPSSHDDSDCSVASDR